MSLLSKGFTHLAAPALVSVAALLTGCGSLEGARRAEVGMGDKNNGAKIDARAGTVGTRGTDANGTRTDTVVGRSGASQTQTNPDGSRREIVMTPGYKKYETQDANGNIIGVVDNNGKTGVGVGNTKTGNGAIVYEGKKGQKCADLNLGGIKLKGVCMK